MTTHRETEALEDVLADIKAERERQNQKWGEQNHPDGTGANILALSLDFRTGGELSNIFRRKTDQQAQSGHVTWRDILLEEVFEALAESDPERLRTELIQVAAVASQWAQAIDHRVPAGAGKPGRSTT